MSKIILNEEELTELIKETTNRILKNLYSPDLILTLFLKNLDKDFLKSMYYDYNMVPFAVNYDDRLSPICCIKEVCGSILDPDEAVFNIRRRYRLDERCFYKQENCNKVAIYILIADIGNNNELIRKDMEKLGYFVGAESQRANFHGMNFKVIQFEPYSQYQDDETEGIKKYNKFLYHWTPFYNLEDIKEYGLIPSHKNSLFNYPPRVYLIKSGIPDDYLEYFGEKLYFSNKDSRNNGKYVLLKIDIQNLDDNIRFYLDPNSEIGIYTEQTIPFNNIYIERYFEFKPLKNL